MIWVRIETPRRADVYTADGNIVSQENVHCGFQPRRVFNVIINEDEIVIAGRDGLLAPDQQQFTRTLVGQSRERPRSRYRHIPPNFSSSWRNGPDERASAFDAKGLQRSAGTVWQRNSLQSGSLVPPLHSWLNSVGAPSFPNHKLVRHSYEHG
jgi:hypothetical protein